MITARSEAQWSSSSVAELLPDFASTTRFAGNQLVDVDGEIAWMESYARLYHRTFASEGAPATDWILNVRYVDRLERRDGSWRIADRVLVCESERTDVVGGEHPILGPDWHAGTRDRADESCRRALSSDSV